MNRKKTGTGPDRNRLQPDLRLRFIRPENITGCGSSKFGKWVNHYRAGWDRSQPVFTVTTSHDHPTTRRRCQCLGPASSPASTPRQHRPPTTVVPTSTTTHQPQRRHTDNYKQQQDDGDHKSYNDDARQPQRRYPTAATTTHRQRRHIDNRTINAPTTTTTAPTARRQRQR
ncbi:hypothetical protein EDB85DRAFT_1897781 [Lactarius pseudohatsudake]|nr:hypothetical protein EDB85DRAFT_1897781 [Lactarius pseudohatsudake]